MAWEGRVQQISTVSLTDFVHDASWSHNNKTVQFTSQHITSQTVMTDKNYGNKIAGNDYWLITDTALPFCSVAETVMFSIHRLITDNWFNKHSCRQLAGLPKCLDNSAALPNCELKSPRFQSLSNVTDSQDYTEDICLMLRSICSENYRPRLIEQAWWHKGQKGILRWSGYV